jgi:hypothetical protein
LVAPIYLNELLFLQEFVKILNRIEAKEWIVKHTATAEKHIEQATF